MGFIDQAKIWHQKLLDRTIPQRVVFHHVPKCGGTSVGRALRKKYLLSQATVLPEESFRAFEAFTGRSDREGMLVDVLDLREQMFLYLLFQDIRCISLHVRYSEIAYRLFAGKYKFITILREPVSRFISHYHWSHGKPNAHARIEETFEAFLETDRARQLGSSYSEYYSGLPKETDFSQPEAIRQAISNLGNFDVVGKLDQLESFERQLHEELGVRLRIGHENKAKTGTSGANRLSTGLMDRVTELCRPDIEIWNAFMEGKR